MSQMDKVQSLIGVGKSLFDAVISLAEWDLVEVGTAWTPLPPRT